LQTIAAQYGVPVWAIAQINKIGADAPLQTGTALVIPLRLYKADAAAAGPPPY
jgi:LysM repeat protein